MAEIVLIYGSADKTDGELLAAEIEQTGTTVADLGRYLAEAPGFDLGQWQELVAHELGPAQALVLVWSTASLRSEWLATAAQLSRDAGKLVILRAGDLKHEALPGTFVHFQSTRVGDWDAIGEAISEKFGAPAAPKPPTAETEQASPRPEAWWPSEEAVPAAAPAPPSPAPNPTRLERALTGPGSTASASLAEAQASTPPEADAAIAEMPEPQPAPASAPPTPAVKVETVGPIIRNSWDSRRTPPPTAPTPAPATSSLPAGGMEASSAALAIVELQNLLGPVAAPVAAPEHSARPGLATAVEDVDCSVFAPPSVRPGHRFLIQVYLHTIEQAARVETLAATLDAGAALRGTQTLQIPLPRDAVVSIMVEGRGLDVGEPEQQLRWTGRPAAATFDAFVPFHVSAGDVLPVVRVAVGGNPVGRIVFPVGIDLPVPNDELLPAPRPTLTRSSARRYSHAFLSYATPDRAEVLKRAQAFQAAGLAYFQDVVSLNPGERYADVILENIDRSDLFVVFWSKAASQSAWVTREIDRALDAQRRSPEGLPDISPIVLDHAGQAPLPAQIAHLHVNDVINYVIAAEEPSLWRRLMRRLTG